MSKPNFKEYSQNFISGILILIITIFVFFIFNVTKFYGILIIIGIMLVSYLIGLGTRLAKYYLFEYEVKDEKKK